ncbi:GH12564 [Drosophila grimshawi]|uniref:GH12564 n=1 Tax=Drosophila grimshawi TaxID=7222 RepID=B4JJZ6_DROGR|nr:GH12564 [Drosophila grimshawi]
MADQTNVKEVFKDQQKNGDAAKVKKLRASAPFIKNVLQTHGHQLASVQYRHLEILLRLLESDMAPSEFFRRFPGDKIDKIEGVINKLKTKFGTLLVNEVIDLDDSPEPSDLPSTSKRTAEALSTKQHEDSVTVSTSQLMTKSNPPRTKAAPVKPKSTVTPSVKTSEDMSDKRLPQDLRKSNPPARSSDKPIADFERRSHPPKHSLITPKPMTTVHIDLSLSPNYKADTERKCNPRPSAEKSLDLSSIIGMRRPVYERRSNPPPPQSPKSTNSCSSSEASCPSPMFERRFNPPPPPVTSKPLASESADIAEEDHSKLSSLEEARKKLAALRASKGAALVKPMASNSNDPRGHKSTYLNPSPPNVIVPEAMAMPMPVPAPVPIQTAQSNWVPLALSSPPPMPPPMPPLSLINITCAAHNIPNVPAMRPHAPLNRNKRTSTSELKLSSTAVAAVNEFNESVQRRYNTLPSQAEMRDPRTMTWINTNALLQSGSQQQQQQQYQPGATAAPALNHQQLGHAQRTAPFQNASYNGFEEAQQGGGLNWQSSNNGNNNNNYSYINNNNNSNANWPNNKQNKFSFNKSSRGGGVKPRFPPPGFGTESPRTYREHRQAKAAAAAKEQAEKRRQLEATEKQRQLESLVREPPVTTTPPVVLNKDRVQLDTSYRDVVQSRQTKKIDFKIPKKMAADKLNVEHKGEKSDQRTEKTEEKSTEEHKGEKGGQKPDKTDKSDEKQEAAICGEPESPKDNAIGKELSLPTTDNNGNESNKASKPHKSDKLDKAVKQSNKMDKSSKSNEKEVSNLANVEEEQVPLEKKSAETAEQKKKEALPKLPKIKVVFGPVAHVVTVSPTGTDTESDVNVVESPVKIRMKLSTERQPIRIAKRRKSMMPTASKSLIDKSELFTGNSYMYEDVVEHHRQEKVKQTVAANKNLATMFERSNDNCSISTHNIIAGKRRTRFADLTLNETQLSRNVFKLAKKPLETKPKTPATTTTTKTKTTTKMKTKTTTKTLSAAKSPCHDSNVVGNDAAPPNEVVLLPPPKTRGKRSELEKLNDDIAQMYYADDVLRATGRRACTVQKRQHQSQTDDGASCSNSSSRLPSCHNSIGDSSSNNIFAINAELEPYKCNLARRGKPFARSVAGLDRASFKDKKGQTTVPLRTKRCRVKIEECKQLKAMLRAALMGVRNTNPDWHSKYEDAKRCVVCTKNVRSPVLHYLQHHNEFYFARMPPGMLQKLRLGIGNRPIYAFKQSRIKYYYHCPFCIKTTEMTAINWVHHIAAHTGEAKYRCSRCKLSRHRIMDNHVAKCGKGAQILHNKQFSVKQPLSIHVCHLCDFVQLCRNNLVHHWQLQHGLNNSDGSLAGLGEQLIICQIKDVPVVTTNSQIKALITSHEAKELTKLKTEQPDKVVKVIGAPNKKQHETIENEVNMTTKATNSAEQEAELGQKTEVAQEVEEAEQTTDVEQQADVEQEADVEMEQQADVEMEQQADVEMEQQADVDMEQQADVDMEQQADAVFAINIDDICMPPAELEPLLVRNECELEAEAEAMQLEQQESEKEWIDVESIHCSGGQKSIFYNYNNLCLKLKSSNANGGNGNSKSSSISSKASRKHSASPASNCSDNNVPDSEAATPTLSNVIDKISATSTSGQTIIENVAFRKRDMLTQQPAYYCMYSSCKFLFSNEVEGLENHIMREHPLIRWSGKCNSCPEQSPQQQQQLSIVDELHHMINYHMETNTLATSTATVTDASADATSIDVVAADTSIDVAAAADSAQAEITSPKLRVRRFTGDRLGTESEQQEQEQEQHQQEEQSDVANKNEMLRNLLDAESRPPTQSQPQQQQQALNAAVGVGMDDYLMASGTSATSVLALAPVPVPLPVASGTVISHPSELGLAINQVFSLAAGAPPPLPPLPQPLPPAVVSNRAFVLTQRLTSDSSANELAQTNITIEPHNPNRDSASAHQLQLHQQQQQQQQRQPTRLIADRFRCMAINCNFCAHTVICIKEHMKFHCFSFGSKDYLQCAYCSHVGRDVNDFVRHGVIEHGLASRSELEELSETFADTATATNPSNSSTSSSNCGTTQRSAVEDNSGITMSNVLELLGPTGFSEKKLYGCPVKACSVSLTDEKPFVSHVMYHMSSNPGMGPLNCKFCRRSFDHPASLRSHLYQLHARHKYFCGICLGTTSNRRLMHQHMMKRHYELYRLVWFQQQFIELNASLPMPHGGIAVASEASKCWVAVIEQPFGPKQMEEFVKKLLAERQMRLDGTKCIYRPSEYRLVPRKAFFTKELFCGECQFHTLKYNELNTHLLAHREQAVRTAYQKDQQDVQSLPQQSQPQQQQQHMMVSQQEQTVETNGTPTLDGSEATAHRATQLLEPGAQVPRSCMWSYVPKDRRFMCGVADCHTHWDTEMSLRRHLIEMHVYDQNFKCLHCSTEENIYTPDKVLEHLSYHKRHIYQCGKCGTFHPKRSFIERHIQEKHLGTNVDIIIAKRSDDSALSTEKRWFKSIATMRIGEIDWVCNLCNKTLVSHEDTVQHVEQVHGRKHQYSCAFCDVENDVVTNVIQHMQRNHSNQRMQPIMNYNQIQTKMQQTLGFYCNTCGKAETIYQQMLNHCGYKHKTNFQFNCPHCPFGVAVERKIVAHLRDEHAGQMGLAVHQFERVTNELLDTDSWAMAHPIGVEPTNGATTISTTTTVSSSSRNTTSAPMVLDNDAIELSSSDEEIEDYDNLEFACLHCTATSGDVVTLRTQHWAKKHKELPFYFSAQPQLRCPECRTFVGNAKSLMENHLPQAHSIRRMVACDLRRPDECAFCNYRYSNVALLTNHIESEEHMSNDLKYLKDRQIDTLVKLGTTETECPNEYYQCKICRIVMPTNIAMAQHGQLVHSNSPEDFCFSKVKQLITYHCSICIFASTVELVTLRHMLDHYKKFRFCNMCGMQQTSFDKYIQHYYTQHRDEVARFNQVHPYACLKKFLMQVLYHFPNGLIISKNSLRHTRYNDVTHIRQVYEELVLKSQQPPIPRLLISQLQSRNVATKNAPMHQQFQVSLSNTGNTARIANRRKTLNPNNMSDLLRPQQLVAADPNPKINSRRSSVINWQPAGMPINLSSVTAASSLASAVPPTPTPAAAGPPPATAAVDPTLTATPNPLLVPLTTVQRIVKGRYMYGEIPQ